MRLYVVVISHCRGMSRRKLLAGRSLQGLGAALMSPAALATVITLFSGASRGKALGVWSALAGVGSALGVVLGGVLTSEAGWRWVFTINVPIGVALLIAIPLVVPARLVPARLMADRLVPARLVPARPPSEAAARGLDVPGAVLVTAGTAAAIYGLINVGSHGWAAALSDAGPAEGGLRSALVNTFHELGGAAGVAVLSSAAGAGLVTAHLGSHDFARAFTVGAACAVVSLAIAVALVPARRRSGQRRPEATAA